MELIVQRICKYSIDQSLHLNDRHVDHPRSSPMLVNSIKQAIRRNMEFLFGFQILFVSCCLL